MTTSPCPAPSLLLQLATTEVIEALHQYTLAEAHFSVAHPTVAAARQRAEAALAFESWAKSLQPLMVAA